MAKMEWYDNVAGWISVAAALAIGIKGFLNYDVFGYFPVETIPVIQKAIGIAAVFFIYRLYNITRR